MKQWSYVIEFLAPPGAGKTTICKSVIDNLSANGASLYRRSDINAFTSQIHQERSVFQRLCSYLKFMKENRSLGRRVTRYVAGFKPRDPDLFRRGVRLTRKVQNWELVAQRFPDTSEFLILDQGLLQQLISLRRFSEGSPSLLFNLLCSLQPYFPDLIVLINLDGESLKDRLEKRCANQGPLGEIDSLTATSAADFEELMQYCTTLATLTQQIKPNCRILELDGTDSISSNVAQILQALESSKEAI